jgi:hypothetical protein
MKNPSRIEGQDIKALAFRVRRRAVNHILQMLACVVEELNAGSTRLGEDCPAICWVCWGHIRWDFDNGEGYGFVP